MKKFLFLSVLIVFPFVASCSIYGDALLSTPTQAIPPTAGQDTPASSNGPASTPPLDLILTGPVNGSEVETSLLTLESYPPQFMIEIRGIRPTPCHQVLITMNEPNDRNEIHLEAMLAVAPDIFCAQVLDEFSTSFNLGSFSAGETFTVWINGVLAAEFTA